MDLSTARRKFFEKNPKVYANFVRNSKLNKNLCFTFDYVDGTNRSNIITEEVKQKISESSKSDNPFNDVIEYIGNHAFDSDLFEKITDCYYDCSVEGKTFKDTNEVCDYINAYISSIKRATSNNNRSIIACYEVGENGELCKDRLFYMELIFKEQRSGQIICIIENTFTENHCRQCGLHTYGVKFLEAVLIEKNIYTIIGDSQDVDLYETGTLEDHYRKLDFEVTTDKYGKSRLYKYIDAEPTMQIKADKEVIK